jgi:hypothetical protein
MSFCAATLDLLVGQRHLLDGLDGGLLLRSGRGLVRRRLIGLRQRVASECDGDRGCKANNAQRGGDRTNELMHGSPLSLDSFQLGRSDLKASTLPQ